MEDEELPAGEIDQDIWQDESGERYPARPAKAPNQPVLDGNTGDCAGAIHEGEEQELIHF